MSWHECPGALWPVSPAPGGFCGTRPWRESAVASGLGERARPAPRWDWGVVIKRLHDLAEVHTCSCSGGRLVPESELKGVVTRGTSTREQALHGVAVALTPGPSPDT